MNETGTGYLLNIQLGFLCAYTILKKCFLVLTISNEDEVTEEEFAGSGHKFQNASCTEE